MEGVEVEIPDEIRAIEDVMRSGLSLPPGNDGKVKAFWKSVAKRLNHEYGLGDATWILKP